MSSTTSRGPLQIEEAASRNPTLGARPDSLMLMYMKSWHTVMGISKVSTALLLVLVPLISPPLQAQHIEVANPSTAFEVATVKVVDRQKIVAVDLRVYPGGRLVIHAHRLAMLIAEAFNIPESEIVGGDQSVLQAWYDVEAKPSEDMRNTLQGSEHAEFSIRDSHVRLMLQSLLIERFHLKFHLESQPGTVYELKHANSPLRLTAAQVIPNELPEDNKNDEDASDTTGIVLLMATRRVELRRTSMLQLSHHIANIRHTPVIDQTGLPGFYNFTSHTIVENEDFAGEGPNHLIVDVLPEMGLKLVKTHGDVEKFVIDNAEWPTAN
jgi:uncharacterized protein (TIGR03435 family)